MRIWISKELRGGGGASIKKAFTLVEMLIVVVIIGILAASILPRITGYLAKTRDMKRQADLRNIAAAIQMYKDYNGRLPFRGSLSDSTTLMTQRGWGTVGKGCKGRVGLERVLSSYFSIIPKDPNIKQKIKIHYYPAHKLPRYDYFRGEDFNGGNAVCPGNYLYQIFQKDGDLDGAAVLVAKVETPELANYVLITDQATLKGGLRGTNYGRKPGDNVLAWEWQGGWENIENLHLCSSVEKVTSGEELFALQEDGRVLCKFSHSDQLYYILKIE